MPIYEYRCPNGHDFERFYRKISDGLAAPECPVCGAVAERRLSGGAGLLFKGSGFYLTDYGKNAHRKPAASGGEGVKSETGGSSGEAKVESKPEIKGESKPEPRPAESKAQSKPAKKSTGSAE